MKFIEAIEDALGIKAKKNSREMQAGDVNKTYADTSYLFEVTGYKAKVGVKAFVDWYRGFYNK